MSHRCPEPLLAGDIGGGRATPARSAPPASAGLLLAPEVAVATGLTQGCMPIGPVRRIDEARDNVVMAIDGRPALAVFNEDIGPELARDPRRLGGVDLRRSAGARLRHRRLSRAQPDGDRSAAGLDRARRGGRAGRPDPVLPPRSRQRPRRSRPHAAAARGPAAGSAASAGIYVSCIARGAALFGEPGVETALIREMLGDFPLIGFFANGEISRDRLYGHTGVLTLFT